MKQIDVEYKPFLLYLKNDFHNFHFHKLVNLDHTSTIYVFINKTCKQLCFYRDNIVK